MFGKNKKTEKDIILDQRTNEVYEVEVSEKELKERKKREKQEQKQRAKEEKARLKKIKKAPKKMKVPKTVQDTIPYISVYPQEGIIETKQGEFTRSYLLQDMNYATAKREDQEVMLSRYADLLNSFDSSIKYQITINNRNLPENYFDSELKLQKANDGLDDLRDEFNEMLQSNLDKGVNNIKRDKYLTISVKAGSLQEARNQFTRLDTMIKENVKKIGGSQAISQSSHDRLCALHDIFNQGNAEFGSKAAWWEEEKDFDFKAMRKAGLTTKDMIGPMSFEFKKDYFVMGDTYARALFLTNFPSYIKDSILTDITAVPINMLTSVNYETIPQIKAVKMLKNQMVSINSNVIDRQKKASRAGYSPETISYELKAAQADAEELLTDISRRNQNMILATIVVVHMANSLEELNQGTKRLEDVAARHMCQFKKLNWQQELGLTSALPLARNELYIKRTLTTESAAIFVPFSSQELCQKYGMYYGVNAVSGNIINYNRQDGKNGNGFILGTPGSGKSFAGKREMVNVLLSRPNDDVIVIDPEREYGPMAEAFHGEVIKISSTSPYHINPMDMDMDYGMDDKGTQIDPIPAKSEFILSICEVVLGGGQYISPTLKSIVDRCVRTIYAPYVLDPEHTKVPTLREFKDLLAVQPDPEAKQLATALELYTTGSLAAFAYETNVNTDNHFIVYDINEVGNSIKTLAMLIVLDSIWNRIIVNRKKGRRTWVYIDEIYLLFTNDLSAEFLKNLFKRARKWGAIPTGITQNVEDILRSEIARTMISNCEFVQMLNQAELDKAQLSALLNISDTQQGYITNANPGEGLIYTGSSIIPFKDEFPQNTKLYEMMNSKPKDKTREKQLEGGN